jgi:4-hydroxy-tetrahydrodipicolinate synthase
MSSDHSLAASIGGVCAAAVTPLDRFDAPDPVATVAHCRRLFALGCDAINLLGTTGEAMSFSCAQRMTIMEAVAASELPLAGCIVGTGASALADAVVLTRAAADLGFAGALVMPPFYFKNMTDDGLLRFFSRLIELVDRAALRVYLYHFPYLSGISFSPALVARLYERFGETIAGLKDSSGVPGYAESIVAVAPIAVFPSAETALDAGRARGFAGCISATVNVSAPLAAAVWHGAQRDPVAAARDQTELTAIRTAIAAYPLVPAIRGVLASMLNDATWRRMVPPLHALPIEDETALAERLQSLPAFAALREAVACA